MSTVLGVEAVTTETGGGEKQAEVVCVDQSHWVTESTKMGGEEQTRPTPRKKPTFKIKVENGQRKNRKGAGFYIKTEIG